MCFYFDPLTTFSDDDNDIDLLYKLGNSDNINVSMLRMINQNYNKENTPYVAGQL